MFGVTIHNNGSRTLPPRTFPPQSVYIDHRYVDYLQLIESTEICGVNLLLQMEVINSTKWKKQLVYEGYIHVFQKRLASGIDSYEC